MPAQQLPLQTKISQMSSGEKSFRLKQVSYGDGYGQRTPDGINYTTHKYSLVYDNISTEDMTTLQTFTDSIGGGAYFLWTPPGYTVDLKWVLESAVKVNVRAGNIYSVTFSIRQVFDLP